jgi:beta-barrel assembly-enhancing protease
MSNDTALYFDEKHTDGLSIRVLLFNSAIHLYAIENNALLHRFPLAGTQYKKTEGHHYLFLNDNQTQYLQLANDHPLATTLSREVTEANMSLSKRLLRNRALLILSFLLAFLTGVYFLIISLVPYFGTKMIGVQQEIEMGDQLHASMLAQARLLGEETDAAGTLRLQAFADELQLSRHYPIRVTLLKSSTINAYALPGGNVVVYTGLLQKIKTPEALAALLAHECTHVNERHSLRSLLRSAASSIALSVVFGDAGGAASVVASNVQALNGLRYSRSLEEEADTKGMDLLLQNGVAADGMKQLMQTLQQAETNTSGTLSFFSSHPLTEERLKAAENYISQHPLNTSARADLQSLFREIKSSY